MVSITPFRGGLLQPRQAPTTASRPSNGLSILKSSSTVNKNPVRERKRNVLFSTTKRDKRTIKHSALISRIEKSKAPSKKSRRPSKKLVTTLESLADALPDNTNEPNGTAVVGDAKIRHKSLKSRPGAMKKKEALVNMEKERFNRNLAQMAALPTDSDSMTKTEGTARSQGSSGTRWAALKKFIRQTTE